MSLSHFFSFFGYLNFTTVRKTITDVCRQRLPSLSAEMAFFSILGLFPGILAILTAIGLYQPLQTAFNKLADQLLSLALQVAPAEALSLIQDAAEGFAHEISSSQNRGLFSLSFAIAIWASSGALSSAMRALDQIHQIPPQRIRPFWKAKLVSLGLTVGTILLLVMASTLVFISDWIMHSVASQGGEAFSNWVLSIWRLFSWPMALGIVSLAFAFIYRFGPSCWKPGKPLLPGAVLAALSWAVLSGLFRLYVTHFSNYNRVYGAVGAVIILLLWLYLSSLVMLIGDQLNMTVGEAMQTKRQKQIQAVSRLTAGNEK
ncbi:MAG: YihY/virulence factor BrkB family protein [Cyanothece sp. SIO1E1]|nr:YihY/virulence factor BrkB family protein [Cyanothece sp. SIO1E1]